MMGHLDREQMNRKKNVLRSGVVSRVTMGDGGDDEGFPSHLEKESRN